MSNFLRNLPVYQPSGTPAYAWVQFPAGGLLTGDNVVINGDTYTFGTDFFGQSTAQALRSLVAAIRADQSDANEVSRTNTNFFRSYWSCFEGSYAVIFAVVPGPAGNAMTLTTNAPTRITISGATFSGGASSALTGGGVLIDGSGVITSGGTSQQIFAANAGRRYLLIQNQSSESLWVNFGVAAVGSRPSIQIANSGGSLIFEGSFIPTGTVNIIGATTNDAFTAKQA